MVLGADDVGHGITATLALSLAGSVWYVVIWGIGLVGCVAAYAFFIHSL